MINILKSSTSIHLDQWIIVFENTGSYSKPLLNWLHEYDLNCLEENPLKISRSLGMRRGKSDKIDCMDICRYTYEKKDIITPSKPQSLVIIRLRKFLSRRDFLVRQRSSLKTSLKEQKSFIAEDIYDELKGGNDFLIRIYDGLVKELEEKIEQTILSNQALSKTYKLIRSVIGIGKITAAYLISTTNNFKSFSCSRKYASYCGIAPFPKSSGKKVGANKVSHMANKKVKALLSNCIIQAIRHDPQIAVYYERKRKEGKQPSVVYNAVKNKIIQRVFAVIKRNTPYVKIHTYA